MVRTAPAFIKIGYEVGSTQDHSFNRRNDGGGTKTLQGTGIEKVSRPRFKSVRFFCVLSISHDRST